jgi:glycopeptide antibiotics resistance protein
MRRRWLLALTGVYAIALASVGFWRSPIDKNVPVVKLPPVVWMQENLGLSISESYHLVEASANAVLFMPLGALVLLWRRDWTWLQATLIALATTALIETGQQVLRPERFAAMSDIVANTLGGAVGALLVVGWRRLRR